MGCASSVAQRQVEMPDPEHVHRKVRGAAKVPLVPQVFISHTGQDDGAKNFAASILQPALHAAGLRTFMDLTELHPGDEWRPELAAAAANSAVVVAVLSRSYPRRFWCMLELDLALRSHGGSGAAGEAQQREQQQQRPRVIPVYYDARQEVDKPIELPGGNSVPLAEYWARHHWEQRGEPPSEFHMRWLDPQQWATNVMSLSDELQALRRAMYPQKDGDVRLAYAVVAEALRHARPTIDVKRQLFGFEAQTEELLRRLRDKPGLWLHGPGGSGKSTMALQLFNRVGWEFPVRAYVSLAKGADEVGLTLQARVAEALQQLGGEPKRGASLEELSSQLAHHVAQLAREGKCVLLVVDNVWLGKQFEALVPDVELAASTGSWLIITSRLQCEAVCMREQSQRMLQPHEMMAVEGDDAARMFLCWAGLDSVPPGLGDLQRAILDACAGLPLALQLAGAALQGKASEDKAQWQAVRDGLASGIVLAKDTEARLERVLSLNLQRLEMSQEKAVLMFLDVVSLMAGEPHSDAMAVWTEWHTAAEAIQGWQALELHGLASCRGGVVAVHDVVRALGRRKITDTNSTHYGSRLWCNEGGTPCIRGDGAVRRPPPVCVRLPSPAHLDLSEARVVCLEDVSMWAYSLDRLKSPEDALRAPQAALLLALSCRLTSTSLGWLHGGSSLRLLRLSGCPIFQSQCIHTFSTGTSLMDAVLRHKHLEVLAVFDCEELQYLPESFEQLAKLRELDLTLCKALAALPKSFGQLKALRKLDLRGCEALAELPESFGKLAALQTLSLSGCKALVELPESFWQLAALQTLHLVKCEALTALPESFWKLAALQTLDLDWCKALTALPESFGQLKALRKLDLSGCEALAELPESFWQLTALQTLDLSWCKALMELPESFWQLAALQTLHLRECKALTALPESFWKLAALQTLTLMGCTALAALPESFGQLKALRKLDLVKCEALTALPESFWQLTALQTLDLSWCKALMELPESFWQLAALQTLHLRACKALTALPESFWKLAALQTLDLSWCKALTALPKSFGQLAALQTLHLVKCEALTALPESFWQLTALQTLDLSWCKALTALPKSFGQLAALQTLDLRMCKALTALPKSFGQLAALQTLDLRWCKALTALPESFWQLTALQTLHLRWCTALAALPESFGQLAALRELNLSWCTSLAALPESFGQLAALRELNLSWCTSLAALPESFGQLAALQTLDLYDCTALTALPKSFGRLAALHMTLPAAWIQ